jgi:hypothetical protein
MKPNCSAPWLYLEILSWTSGFSWRGTAQESWLIQVLIPNLGRIQVFKATQIATKINK